MSDWEDLSDWYDKKQGETGDLWHRALIDPPLLKLIGSCQGKDVLDLGCGNGYLSRRLARDGARVTAVDSSTKMIQNAKTHDPNNSLGIRYMVANANRMSDIKDASHDLVFANMSLMDIEDAEGTIHEVARILKSPKGRFVASISHPCFDTGSQSGWVMEKWAFDRPKIYRKVRAYRTPFSDKIPWALSSGLQKHTLGFHRPLNWYASIFNKNGLYITALEEPMPTEEFLRKEREYEDDLDAKGFLEVPLHLVFEAVKQ